MIVAFDAEAIAAGNRGLACDEEAVAARVDDLLARMSLAQKVAQMHGLQLLAVDGLYQAGGVPELGIPALKMVDGPRGLSKGTGTATAFPVGMARGATWDPALEKRVGAAIALEVRARGGNVLLAPTINILRHPGWGRSQETYGEDPFHMGALAVGFIAGAQNHVVASAKHFALNSIEDTRFDVDVSVDPRTLHEVYLPHFRRAVEEAGVGSVMSAYNKVEGAYCAENRPLLTDILKEGWGFRGFVESDWVFGVYSTVPSALAGLDIEMPTDRFFGDDLLAAIEAGEVPQAVVDGAVRRILRTSLCFGLDELDPVDPAVIEGEEHRALAREVARKSMVLLKNDGAALPLERGEVKKIAVVGALAGLANLGDHGSSEVVPAAAVSPLAGLQAAAGDVEVVALARDQLDAAELSQVADADAAVVVVGLTWEDEGEAIPFQDGGGDRDSLRLRDAHEQLIRAVAAENPRTIVVLEGGGAIVVRPWVDEVPAVLMAWYPGMEGGHALAELLFGEVAPSGKLPLTVPRDPAQLPPFDHEGLAVTYDYFHGYRLLDRDDETPEFAFGHGLSYTSFGYQALRVEPDTLAPGGAAKVSVEVTNTGSRAAEEVVQLYVGYPDGVTRPRRELKGFGRVALAPGETVRLEMELAADSLAYYDAEAVAWRTQAGRHTIAVGSSSRDLPLTGALDLE